MDWIPTCVVVFGAGALFGLALGLFMIGEIEGKPRDKIKKERLNTIEEILKNQSEINQGQVEINQTQAEINEHLADWIRAVEKMKK